MQRLGGNRDAPRVVRQFNTRMDYQNPSMQHTNVGNPQSSRYPPLPNPNHQYIYPNQPSSSYPRQNDYIQQQQFPNSIHAQTHQKEAPRVIYNQYDQNISRQGINRPLLDNRFPTRHHEQPLELIPSREQFAKSTQPSNRTFQNQCAAFNDPEVINVRTEPQARYQYLPESHRTLQFPQAKESSLISRPYLEEYLPIEQGIQTPIPIHATPEFESENLKSGPSETYNYLPGAGRDLTSAFKPYTNSHPREREPASQSDCRETFHSRQYNERQNGEAKDPFDKTLFNNQYHTNIANRDRFIIPIRENSEFENQDKRKLISNKVQVIMEDPSEFNSAPNTRKSLETLETAELSQNRDKIKYAQRIAHKFDDASKQIIIPAPSKIKVRTKHPKTSQLAGMLNHVAAGASTFDGNSYLVQTMVGGVDGMNPMHTAYQQQYLYPPMVQPEYQYQYIPQYVTYNQPVPIPSYVPENEYGGTYFQLAGTNNASYNPANAYVQQTYSESDNSWQSSQEDPDSHGKQSVMIPDAVQQTYSESDNSWQSSQEDPDSHGKQSVMIPDANTNKDEIQMKSMPEKLLDMPTFDEHDPLGLTRKELLEDTLQPKQSMKAAVQQLENNGEELIPILQSEVIPSRMSFPDQPENMSVNGTDQGSIKGFDRMSSGQTDVDIVDDFEDFLLGTAKPSETGTEQSETQAEKDLFDLDELFVDDYYNHGVIQQASSKQGKSAGLYFPNSQNTTKLDNQNAFQKSVGEESETPSNNTTEDKYDDFIAELLGENTNTDDGTGTTHGPVEEIQSGNSNHTPSIDIHQDEQLSQFGRGEVEVSPVSGHSREASEDFYSELLEDLLGNTERDGAASTMPENEAAVDLSSNCEPLGHFDEPSTHSLQDLVKDMGSSVSAILSDILSTSN